MAERPILFSAPMVRAILAGQKTQTRRVIKDQLIGERYSHTLDDGRAHLEWLGTPCCGSGVWDVPEYSAQVSAPYGLVGDRLWVREGFSYSRGLSDDDRGPATGPVWFWADGNPGNGDWTKPKPSIHMPRWASRITLEITGVRVERLQAISEADARAEGCAPAWLDEIDHKTVHAHVQPTYRRGFARLWGEINGDESWDANPWVWVVEFKRAPITGLGAKEGEQA